MLKWQKLANYFGVKIFKCPIFKVFINFIVLAIAYINIQFYLFGYSWYKIIFCKYYGIAYLYHKLIHTAIQKVNIDTKIKYNNKLHKYILLY